MPYREIILQASSSIMVQIQRALYVLQYLHTMLVL